MKHIFTVLCNSLFMTQINLAIVGSRDITDRETVVDAIEQAKDQLNFTFDDVNNIVTSENADGVDEIARKLADTHDIPTIEHKAHWEEYGRSAGPQRNKLIVEDSDVVIAVQKDNSPGTQSTIDLASGRPDMGVFVYQTDQSLLDWE